MAKATRQPPTIVVGHRAMYLTERYVDEKSWGTVQEILPNGKIAMKPDGYATIERISVTSVLWCGPGRER